MTAFRRIRKWTLVALLTLWALSVVQVLAFKWLPVPRTPLMIGRSWEYRKDDTFKTRYRWVPLSAMSKQLQLAVIASEDSRFKQHHGFDWIEIDRALHRENRKRLRGASTISQQVAKNVFLWQGRSWLRKGLEAYYTLLIELFWSKERILEVYLNVVEMGRGIYGAEAAARHYYHKPPAQLTAAEAALLAACLPNPLQRNPSHPTPYLKKRRQEILRRMN